MRPFPAAVRPEPRHRMPTLRDLVQALHRRPGVAGVVVLGRDGLLVEVAGLAPADAERVAAMAPGLLAAADALGEASGRGALATAVLEHAGGLTVACTLGREVAVLAQLVPDTDPSPLVAEVRRSRAALAALV